MSSQVLLDTFRGLSVCAYGAMMALAGLIVDCAWDSQPSSCAFSWDPGSGESKELFQTTESMKSHAAFFMSSSKTKNNSRPTVTNNTNI